MADNHPLTVRLTIPEVAARIRVTEETVGRWLTAGKLPGIRISGRRWVVDLCELEAWERARSNRPESAAPKPKPRRVRRAEVPNYFA